MKICVSIAPATMEQAVKSLRELKQAEIVELRIDRLRDLDVSKLLHKPRPPVIVTNRRASEGGAFKGSAKKQVDILLEASRSGADYVDIEMSFGKRYVEDLVRNAPGKVIVSFHDFRKTPPDLLSRYDEMSKSSALVLKIVTMANDISDNEAIFRLLSTARTERRKMIAFCMGERGQVSRVLSGKYGSYLTFAPVSAATSTAPGQIPLEDLKNTYRVSSLRRNTRVFGLVGNPVSRSRGIYYHNQVFTRKSVNAVYINFLVDRLETFMPSFRDEISGLSITMPFKQQIIPFLDSIESEAAELRSVNTVIRRRGLLIGSNTDLPAIRWNLAKVTTLKRKAALVLGTGATARTMAFACLSGGAAVTVAGRSADRARSLAGELGCDWTTLDDLHGRHCDLLLNGTSLGMRNDVPPLPRGFLKQSMIVFDAVYSPPETPLLAKARKAGCVTIAGTQMFLRQAHLQSKLFLQTLQS